ncbi:MAG: TetR family transcriptional regulator [Actinobacteria bacterium]|nr:TetR family transcriptional regulator [Actinomycetota bacterium]
MAKLSQHTEWLSLVEVSGPFLAVAVLERVFPQGLDVVATPKRKRMRMAYEEWLDAIDENDRQLQELHHAWVELVLAEVLEYEGSLIRVDDDESLVYISREHNGSFTPDFVLGKGNGRKPHLLVSIQPPGADLEKAEAGDNWPASIVERMTLLCRTTGVRLGLITNGERWMLVNAPIGASSSYISWHARLWLQEPLTLKAFQSLLGVRRFYGPEDETLEALLDASLEHQEEVTDTLGEQVRRAVEVLVQALDKADQDRNRALLNGVSPTELYEAGLTVMMRLVFVLCAEERGLLLLGDPAYDQYYAISTLRGRLTEEADHHGAEVLERRYDAWSQLLSVFRAIFGGVEHETLRLPALGGSLFDPDRFPFLEGRLKDTRWRDTIAVPLPIDNRTVLLLLESLQILEQRGGALLLSYKALDVEQIGHVYEGLLEYTVERLSHVTLGLEGSNKAKNPNLGLGDLESARLDSEKALVELIKEATQRSESAIRNALKREADDTTYSKVLNACAGEAELAKRIRPFAHLLRTDAWGEFIVYGAGSFAVTLGDDRRDTGTHYTPKALTETIVETTLKPIVHIGPAEGKPREQWILKSSAVLLDLKICDPAMGSGAFLVQACRWLAEKLVEAWNNEEAAGKYIAIDGEAKDDMGSYDPMPDQLDDRLLIARRMIAEKCLYGVDRNPLAVELAKLSIWLVTLAKGRPFGFLDHNLRCGDSLLGINRLDQLISMSMNPASGAHQLRTFEHKVESAIADAIKLRKKLRDTPIRDIHDVEAMTRLDLEARKKLEAIDLVADAMIGEVLSLGGNTKRLEVALSALSITTGDFLSGKMQVGEEIAEQALVALATDSPKDRIPRKPFHWPLEFPEIFVGEGGGFSAIIGNPPFMGGQKITGSLGTCYRDYLVAHIAFGKKGSVDLCSYFFLRVASLIGEGGRMGLLATNTIAQGNTREVGLQQLVERGFTITEAVASEKWPGKANLEVAIVWIQKGVWEGVHALGEKRVAGITSYLTTPGEITGDPYRLKANEDKSFQGSIVLGMGFVLEPHVAQALIKTNIRNLDVIFPYLNGEDLNSRPDQSPSRWVINFFDWPLKRMALGITWAQADSKQKKQWLQDGIVPVDYPDPVAFDYPDCLQIVEAKVKPERQKLEDNPDGRRLKKFWWKYCRYRPGLYVTVGCLDRVLVRAQVSRTWAWAFVQKGIVYDAKLIVFAFDSFDMFSLFQSSIHFEWAVKYMTTLRLDMSYTPTRQAETFPNPSEKESLDKVGKLYYDFRQGLMRNREEGLTTIHNRLNNPNEKDSEIQLMRQLQAEMDNTVVAAYGWDDLILDHGFYETKQGLRYTISREASTKVLQRLLELNHERYEEEVQQGLHDKKKTHKRGRSKLVEDNNNPTLLEGDLA